MLCNVYSIAKTNLTKFYNVTLDKFESYEDNTDLTQLFETPLGKLCELYDPLCEVPLGKLRENYNMCILL